MVSKNKNRNVTIKLKTILVAFLMWRELSVTRLYLWNKNQLMSLFQFYLYIAGSIHVSGPQAHPQESSNGCSHNHWFSVCTALAVCSVCCAYIQSTRPEQYRHWTNGCVNSRVTSPEDGPVGPKHVEIRQYINIIEIVTSVGFYSICWKDAWYKKLKRLYLLNKVIPAIYFKVFGYLQQWIFENNQICDWKSGLHIITHIPTPHFLAQQLWSNAYIMLEHHCPDLAHFLTFLLSLKGVLTLNTFTFSAMWGYYWKSLHYFPTLFSSKAEMCVRSL